MVNLKHKIEIRLVNEEIKSNKRKTKNIRKKYYDRFLSHSLFFSGQVTAVMLTSNPYSVPDTTLEQTSPDSEGDGQVSSTLYLTTISFGESSLKRIVLIIS